MPAFLMHYVTQKEKERLLFSTCASICFALVLGHADIIPLDQVLVIVFFNSNGYRKKALYCPRSVHLDKKV